MIRRPPRSTLSSSSAASDVYKRQIPTASRACSRCCAPCCRPRSTGARMTPEADPAVVWTPLAWLPEGWRADVLLRASADGRWADVKAGVIAPPVGARVVGGPLLPAVVDAHSHA